MVFDNSVVQSPESKVAGYPTAQESGRASPIRSGGQSGLIKGKSGGFSKTLTANGLGGFEPSGGETEALIKEKSCDFSKWLQERNLVAVLGRRKNADSLITPDPSGS